MGKLSKIVGKVREMVKMAIERVKKAFKGD